MNQLTEFCSRPYLTKDDLAGGRVAEQLESWNGNPEALSSIPALNKALAGFFSVVPSLTSEEPTRLSPAS